MAVVEQALAALLAEGASAAMEHLSLMLGQRIEAKDVRVRASALAEMIEGFGDDSPALGVRIEGIAGGHMVLIYAPETAAVLVDLLTLQEPGTTTAIGAMERSALRELGAILGTAFCGILRDGEDVVMATPIAGDSSALLNEVTGSPADGRFVVEATLRGPERDVGVRFLVFVSAGLMEVLSDTRRAA